MLAPEFLWLALKVVFGALILFNVYVTLRLMFFSGCAVRQKIFHFLIVWWLPIVGPILVHSLIAPPKWKPPDHAFSPQGRSSYTAGTGGGS